MRSGAVTTGVCSRCRRRAVTQPADHARAGQPTIVTATGLTAHTGAWGGDLTVEHRQLRRALPRHPQHPGHQAERHDARRAAIPHAATATNPHNGRSLVLYKRDIGAGQPLSTTLDGYHYRIDLTPWAEQQLGLTGSAIVQVTRLDGPTNGPGGGPAARRQRRTRAYANPFAHTGNLTPQRIDMGVDYDGQGEIDAIGDAHIAFAGTGIGGGWVCSTPTNGGVVYQLDDGPDQGKWVYVAEDVIPSVGRRHRARGQQIATFAPPGGTGCIEIGWAPAPAPRTDRSPGRRLPGRQRLRRLAHRRRRQHERPDPLTRRPLRHLPQPTDRRPLPVSCATSHARTDRRSRADPAALPTRRTKPGTPGVADGVLR